MKIVNDSILELEKDGIKTGIFVFGASALLTVASTALPVASIAKLALTAVLGSIALASAYEVVAKTKRVTAYNFKKKLEKTKETVLKVAAKRTLRKSISKIKKLNLNNYEINELAKKNVVFKNTNCTYKFIGPKDQKVSEGIYKKVDKENVIDEIDNLSKEDYQILRTFIKEYIVEKDKQIIYSKNKK